MAMPADDLRDRLLHVLAGVSEVRLAYLFGSRATGRARRDSDIDVAALVDDTAVADPSERGRTIRRLAGALGTEVASDKLDIVLLNGAPPLLRHRVLRDGLLLHARSPEERVRFAIRAIRDTRDTEVRRDFFTWRRIERLREGQRDGGPGDLLEKARGVGRLLEEARRLQERP